MDILKNIPSVHEILNFKEITALKNKYRYDIVKKITLQILDEFRIDIKSNSNKYTYYTKEEFLYTIIKKIEFTFENLENGFYKKVINASGIAIHTNLGRSPISYTALNNISELLSSYMNIEYDLSNSTRFDRNKGVAYMIKLLTDCEDAIVVNNNAAALLLIFDTFCKNKNAILSRGELIEIGDNFRLLDIINTVTSNIKEVGSTNRTYIKDYENAIDENTSLILKVNKSNYEISGFVQEVSSKNLSDLCKKNNIILVEDLGSGNLTDISKYSLNYERTVSDTLKDGADIVCFSTDKLLGACQASIIAGNGIYIQKLRKNSLFRALRVGKDTISALFESLKLYIYQDFESKIPILNIISAKKELLYKRAETLYNLIDKSIFDFIEIENSIAYIGGGVSSNTKVESFCLSLKTKNLSTRKFESFLRSKNNIIGYIKNDKLILDMFCIFDEDLQYIADSINFLKNISEIISKKDDPASIFFI